MRHGIDWMVVLITVSAIALCSVDAVAQCTPTHALNIRLVDADAQGPGEDGRSWPCAYRSLDAALFEASQGLAITEIWVAASTYIPITQFNANNPPFPTDFAERTATFPVRSYLHVHGGFLGNAHPSGGETSLSQADPEANETILSGEVTIAGKNDNSYHVLVLRAPDGPLQNNRTIIDGFTIIDGIANGALNNAIGGGAMVFPTGTVAQIPLFSRCKFIGNRAAAGGGAVSSGFNSAEFRDCAFIDNEAVGNGSSVHAGGGAIQASLGFDNQLRVAKCRFENNRCPENFGGAIKSEALSTKVVNSTFLENEALRGGATYSTGTYAGCLFAGNLATTAVGNGGGGHGLASAQFRDCTFVHNSSPNALGGGAISPSTVTNCIFWANSDSGSSGHGSEFTGTVCPTYSTVDGFAAFGGCTGATVLTTDPDFMDIDGLDNNPSTVLDNDYRLRVTSNAKDSGSNTNVPADELDVNDNMNSTEKLPWDLDKKNRFLPSPSGVVDRGVFEFSCYGDCVTSATLAPPPDGNVDAADLAYLLGAWGPNPGHCSDIVTSATFAPPPDGTVDSADLSMLLSWWGTPCENPAQGGEGLMGGEDSGPFDGTYFGMLLEELLATNDADLAEMIAELLSETLSE